MELADMVGGAAATFTTVAFMPQALRVLRTRETAAISLAMYTLFTTGVMLWGIFGLMTWQWHIIIANAVTVSFASLILGLKLRDVLAARKARQGG